MRSTAGWFAAQARAPGPLMTGCASWRVSGGGTSSAGALGDQGCLPVRCRAPSVGSMATNASRDLFGMGAWPPGVLEACGPCLSQRCNVLVTGITGAGKTTLLQALARLPRPTSPCLSWTTAKSWTWTVRSASLSPCGAATLPNRLAKPWRERSGTRPGASFSPTCALPRPERVLRALGGGRHHGSLLAIGAPSAETALRQLATWSLADGFSWEAACAAIPTAIDVVVRLDREASSSRRAAEVCRVEAGAGGWALRPA